MAVFTYAKFIGDRLRDVNSMRGQKFRIATD